MGKKRLSFEVLITLQIIALVFAGLSNMGWYRITDWLLVFGIVLFSLAVSIYLFLYLQKGMVATTLKRNSSSLRNILVVVLAIVFVIAVVFNIVGIVILLVNSIG